MGQKHSRDKLMYHYVINGDIGGIQFLSQQGASLEWKDKEGKTPLIVAAKEPGLYDVAKTLIEMGANVNALCKGHKGGTPLHYAAREGHDSTVALLLSHGANAFVKNRENQTPLDVARKNSRNLVVREIECRVCFFAGHIRERFGPGLSDVTTPQSSSSAVIWVVVVPRSPHLPPRAPKLELVIYSTPQDAAPRKIVSLRRSKIKAPKFDQPSPTLTILDKQTKTRYKFSSVTFNDKQQLRRLYNACKGISQVITANTTQIMNTEATNTPLHPTLSQISNPVWRTPRTTSPPMTPNNNIWLHDNDSPTLRDDYTTTANWGFSNLNNNNNNTAVTSPTPSAPPVNSSITTAVNHHHHEPVSAETDDNPVSDSALCVVCFQTPVQGACIPCGHVSTCMSCLNKIKANNEVCPICRAQILQVVKLFGIEKN